MVRGKGLILKADTRVGTLLAITAGVPRAGGMARRVQPWRHGGKPCHPPTCLALPSPESTLDKPTSEMPVMQQAMPAKWKVFKLQRNQREGNKHQTTHGEGCTWSIASV